MPQFCVLHTQLGVLWCTWQLGAATWGVESRPAEGTTLAVRGQPEGMGLRSSATRNACGGSMDRHRSKVPLLSDVQRVGSPLQSLSPCASARALGEGVSFWSWLACAIITSWPLLSYLVTCNHDHCFGSLQTERLMGSNYYCQHLPSWVAHSL